LTTVFADCGRLAGVFLNSSGALKCWFRFSWTNVCVFVIDWALFPLNCLAAVCEAIHTTNQVIFIKWSFHVFFNNLPQLWTISVSVIMPNILHPVIYIL